MAQLCTATFITDTGWATGLTPTVEIVEALTGTVIWVFNMSEIHAGNYIYNYDKSDDTIVYFFNFDAGTDSVINRYQGNNNKVETTVNNRVNGWSIIYNNQISKEKVQEIADAVIKMIPEQKEIQLDMSKIEEKLDTIEDKIEMKEIEFDYSIILNSNDKNTQKIIKKVEWIKIPKQDNKEVINYIKEIKLDTSPIQEDIKKISDKLEEIEDEKEEEEKKKNQEKIEKLNNIQIQLKWIETEIQDWLNDVEIEEPKQKRKNKLPDVSKLHEEMMDSLHNEDDFKSLITEND